MVFLTLPQETFISEMRSADWSHRLEQPDRCWINEVLPSLQHMSPALVCGRPPPVLDNKAVGWNKPTPEPCGVLSKDKDNCPRDNPQDGVNESEKFVLLSTFG